MAVVTSSRAARKCCSRAVLAGCLLAASVGIAAWSATAPAVDFARDVAPIFQQRCIRCHRPENRLGGISLATAADLQTRRLVVPGKPERSPLLAVVRAAPGGTPRMPKEGAPLLPEQVSALERWIAGGARWPKAAVIHERAVADRSWWSLRPLKRGAPPQTAGLPAGWKANPIDRFVYAGLAKKGLTPSPPADRRTLLRRLTYDLTGLPPTPEETAAFLADSGPGAYERVVDRLLASPGYGEHWGRHWLDVVRFGESRGYERNEIIPNAWPFRDYVIRSFNEDKPYDRLVQEHLAGDVLAGGDPAVDVGVTFLTCGPYDDVGNQDPIQAATIRANTLDDMIRATGETFLGFTIGCARCHDHKFDPVSTRDYYAMFATFAGVRHGVREMATRDQRDVRAARVEPLQREASRLAQERAEVEAAILARAERQAAALAARWVRPAPQGSRIEERFPAVIARKIRLTVDAGSANPDAPTSYQLDEFEAWTSGPDSRNVAAAAAGAKAEGASRVAEDFADAYSALLTIDGVLGATWFPAGPTLTVTFAAPARIDRAVFSSNRDSPYGKPFPAEYRLEVSNDGSSWVEVAGTVDRQPVSAAHRRRRLIQAEITHAERQSLAALAAQQAQVGARIAAVPALPVWWVGNFDQPSPDVRVYVGGNPARPGDPVAPASPSLLQDVEPPYALPADAREGDRRLSLAKWLTAPENPLTPRVMVNRVWQYHFGAGILDTSSDFGYMGGRPTHPDLLDWLARAFSAPAAGPGGMGGFGWRLKPLHRLIVTSMAYRQASTYRPQAARVDAQSRYLWRFPPRRLAAEELRDTMLSVAGKLSREMGGPGFRLYRYLQDNVATYVPLDHPGPDTYRRAVYHQNARAAFVDVLSDFDCPDNAFGAPRRAATTTPLQALTLLNHAFTLDMGAALAQRLEREAPAPEAERRVRRAFELAYSRPPVPAELAAAAKLIRARGLRAFCRALLNSNEFIFVD